MHVPYRTSMNEIKQFLQSHLYTFAPFVNIRECARAVIYDYFSSVFNSPYPCTIINGSSIYLNEGITVNISNVDYAYIGQTVNSSFWVASKAFSYMLNHCGHSSYQSTPTDCYFVIDNNDDVMVYVPLHSSIPIEYSKLAIPANALMFAVKGGTSNA